MMGKQAIAGKWAPVICLAVPAVVLLASIPLGVRWLEPGDLGWREAMAYHGVIVPAWMLLILASFDRLVEATTAARWCAMVARGATAAALLTGIGALLVRRQGLSAAAVLLPLAAGKRASKGWLGRVTATGAAITLLASLVQVVLYQYSAWAGWEPPDLFVSGPNAIPLDDALLTVLGIGLLLLAPALLTRKAGGLEGTPLLDGPRLLAMAYLAFAVMMFGVGLYIERHEGFFGGGEAGAPGALKDLFYIRAHVLIGCMGPAAPDGRHLRHA
ncbi:MAG: hypothetical protein ACC742_05195 [Thermoanaerobaculales bacterium]